MQNISDITVASIDTDNWNPATDKLLAANYDAETAIANKKTLQESLGLDVDDHKIVIGLIYGKAYAIRACVFFKKMKPAYNICRINK